MSMFNLMMGVNPFAGLLLKILGFTQPAEQIPRLRDCYVDSEGYVVVLTRTGGGNRAEYTAENQALASRAGFVSSTDWEIDSTYAEWRYNAPEEHSTLVLQLAECGARCNLTEKFQTVLADLDSPSPKPSTQAALERLKPLADQIARIMES